MDKSQYQAKMETIKKLIKIGFFASLILGIASLILFVCFNFMGVLSIKTLDGTKYQNGFTYPGWQIIYYGVGEMIIQGYTEYTFNIFNFLGFFLPALMMILWLFLYLPSYKRKGTNRKKAVLEILSGVLILFGAVMLFNCDKFAVLNAKNVKDSYQNYYQMYLVPAINGELYFKKTFYPTLILIVGGLTSAVKILNGLLLIYQKNFAKKNKGVNAK